MEGKKSKSTQKAAPRGFNLDDFLWEKDAEMLLTIPFSKNKIQILYMCDTCLACDFFHIYIADLKTNYYHNGFNE